MRSTRFGACAGVAIFGVSLVCLAQPPEGKGKPAHAGRPQVVDFPVPQHSVGVMHAASLVQSQRPAPPPPSVTAPGPASGGIGHAFGKGGGNGAATGQIGNGPGNGAGVGLGIGQIDKAPGKAAGAALTEKAPLDEARTDDGKRYSLQAVLPVAPGTFPSVQKEASIPECFAR